MTATQSSQPATRRTPSGNNQPTRRATNQLATDPSFPEAERATLGALMLSPTAAARLLPVLREEHFYFWQNRHVFNAIRDVHERGRPIDPITVHAQLREKGQTRFGYRDAGVYLADCLEATYFPGRALDYAATVLDTAARRSLLNAGLRVTQRASHPAGTTEELVDDALKQIHNVREILQERDALLRQPADQSDGLGL